MYGGGGGVGREGGGRGRSEGMKTEREEGEGCEEGKKSEKERIKEWREERDNYKSNVHVHDSLYIIQLYMYKCICKCM